MGIRPVNRGPFGGEPIIFDTLLFVREACQIRRLEVSRPCLAERGLRVESHLALFLGGVCVTRVPLGGASHLFLPSRPMGIRPSGGFQSEPVTGGCASGPSTFSILICICMFISILIVNLDSEILIQY